MKNTIPYLIVLILACLLPSCSTPRGFVAKEWSNMLREMQIAPVFPPREDIEPGDIYSDPYPYLVDEKKVFKKKGYLAIPHRLYSLDIKEELDNYYRERFEFPKTPVPKTSETPEEKEGNPFEEAVSKGDQSVYKTTATKKRLPHVGFPEFSSVTITTGNLQALVPVHALSVVFGGAWSDFESVSLKLRATESYGLPQNQILDKFFKTLYNKENPEKLLKLPPEVEFAEHLKDKIHHDKYRRLLIFKGVMSKDDKKELLTLSQDEPYKNAVEALFQSSNKPLPEDLERVWHKGAFVRMVNEVFTVRDIEITAIAKQSVGGRAGTKPSLEELNKQLESLADAGGYFELTGVSDRAITLKRVYYRPLVIGVKFIRLKRYQYKVKDEVVDNGVEKVVKKVVEKVVVDKKNVDPEGIFTGGRGDFIENIGKIMGSVIRFPRDVMNAIKREVRSKPAEATS